jgi:hypothetical protein
MPIIELEINFMGAPIKEHYLLGLPRLEHELKVTKENLSGLICTEHIELPKVEKKVSDGRWVVEIKTCCENSLNLIEKRLDEIYKK